MFPKSAAVHPDGLVATVPHRAVIFGSTAGLQSTGSITLFVSPVPLGISATRTNASPTGSLVDSESDTFLWSAI